MLPILDVRLKSLVKVSVVVWSIFISSVYGESLFANDYDNCGQLPRWCYSCASNYFQNQKHWKVYKDFYQAPKNFSHTCDSDVDPRHTPVMECAGPCLTIIEQVYVFGARVGEIYFRGCMDKTFRSKNVEETSRRLFMQSGGGSDSCKSVQRNVLFNRPKLRGDDLTLCFCDCDRCNGLANVGNVRTRLMSLLHLVSLLIVHVLL